MDFTRAAWSGSALFAKTIKGVYLGKGLIALLVSRGCMCSVSLPRGVPYRLVEFPWHTHVVILGDARWIGTCNLT